MKLTRELLKEKGQAFDPETAQSFDLSNLKIEAIEQLDCPLLIDLNLQNNAIKEIPEKGFSTLSSLTTLNLSSNHIQKIVGIQDAVNLEHLFLHSNAILTFDDLQPLQYLKKLRTLTLRDNPVSKEEDFAKKIQELLPTLSILDGVHLRFSKEINEQMAELKTFNSEQYQLKIPPKQEWLPPQSFNPPPSSPLEVSVFNEGVKECKRFLASSSNLAQHFEAKMKKQQQNLAQ
eukprot:GCRY01000379.1.p2 GENE.GCRY01000379.1~~GCRY01000379.1.p2  ORF type:complete len:232 (+),score=46.78 GCRY01000379.1:245-940(+)